MLADCRHCTAAWHDHSVLNPYLFVYYTHTHTHIDTDSEDQKIGIPFWPVLSCVTLHCCWFCQWPVTDTHETHNYGNETQRYGTCAQVSAHCKCHSTLFIVFLFLLARNAISEFASHPENHSNTSKWNVRRTDREALQENLLFRIRLANLHKLLEWWSAEIYSFSVLFSPSPSPICNQSRFFSHSFTQLGSASQQLNPAEVHLTCVANGQKRAIIPAKAHL